MVATLCKLMLQLLECRFLSRVEGRGSRVEGRGSRVEGKISRVEGQASRVEGVKKLKKLISYLKL